jgi:hypothetical protein
MEKVIQDLKKIAGIEQANKVYGVYDIIVIINARTTSELSEVTLRIQKNDYVESIMTMNIAS